jgi:diguanylate cyclase (GGDEF)-like protein
MPTLFKALLSQHARTLKPMRYAEPMTAQLQTFFEEVVVENKLRALVVESLPLRPMRSMREIERIRRISKIARFPYFLISPEDDLASWYRSSRTIAPDRMPDNLVMLPRSLHDATEERFLVIADTHFSALLTSVDLSHEDPAAGHQVIYTFDPDVVYTALEYLSARFGLENPGHHAGFMEAVHQAMPKSTSLHLTLAVTTKLATLWQEHTGREIAVNRIATEIRQSLELDQILQTAVNEVGTALDVTRCALLIESEDNESESIVYFSKDLSEDDRTIIRADLEAYKRKLRNYKQNYVRDGYSTQQTGVWQEQPQVIVPLSFMENFVGVLFVQADETTRIWKESEVLLLQTVADQVAVAVKHARLYVKSQQEALRDSLTGVFNRRFFEIQYEREFNLAQRRNSSFAVLMLDFDNFKVINDKYTHLVGDSVLKQAADVLCKNLRNFDTVSRYGGEEFVVILPHITEEDAFIVGERLRHKIEKMIVPEVKSVTVSVGVAVYPNSASNMIDLLKAADKALYRAKREGRNRVCIAGSLDAEEIREETDPLDESLIAVGF